MGLGAKILHISANLLDSLLEHLSIVAIENSLKYTKLKNKRWKV